MELVELVDVGVDVDVAVGAPSGGPCGEGVGMKVAACCALALFAIGSRMNSRSAAARVIME